MTFHAQWDMGYLIGLYFAIPIAIISLGVFIAGTISFAKDKTGYGMGSLVMIISGTVLLATIGLGLFVATPFSGQYHRYVPKTGTVAAVGSRIVSSGSGNSAGVNQKFVVTFTDGESYGVLDTRAANVAVGDKLTVLCEREFQFNAPNEGWNCNWGQDIKPNGVVIP